MKRLLLVGGGHAQLSVLDALARARPADVETILVTPSRYQVYSGMLPGWMAGHYEKSQCLIDLEALAKSARIRMLTDRVVGLAADQRQVTLQDGPPLAYDLLSLDVGSETDVSSLQAAREKVLPVKPLDGFFEAWPAVVSAARNKQGYRLLVVGGGAAGVELALAASYAFAQAGADARVGLVACELLPGHAPGVRRRVKRALARARVQVHDVEATGTEEGVLLADGTTLPADIVLAATGARASQWPQTSGLALDAHNYIAVDRFHRSRSHADVFAAGDISARSDVVMGRSGVHAVHAGPVLAANLLATLQGGPLRTYAPRRRSLYLLACGPRYAIAAWGSLSAEGQWVWRWKDRIDREFVARFANPQR